MNQRHNGHYFVLFVLCMSLGLDGCSEDKQNSILLRLDAEIVDHGNHVADGDHSLDGPLSYLDGGLRDMQVATDARPADAQNVSLDTSMVDAMPEEDLGSQRIQTLASTYFAGTHNSYSGEARRSVTEQLNRGIRALEFDFHDNDFARFQDYRVGHFSPGGEVLLGNGNPRSSELRLWLELVAQWSDANVGHAPIILLLDAKDDLKDNHSPEAGNLGALNEMLRQVYGNKLVAPTVATAWPQLSEINDRILIVLSGDRTTRRAYIIDEGVTPAVSSHASGLVVSMHSDGGERLWYWTGRITAGNAGVDWLHHGRYDTGSQPTVAVVDRNTVVEVHRSHTRDRLFGAVGYIDGEGRVNWAEERSLFDGRNPAIRRLADGTLRLTYYTTETPPILMERIGRVVGNEVRFDGPAASDQPAGDVWQDDRLEVISRDLDGHSGRALSYRLREQADWQLIRYEQLMFTEYQNGDGDFLATTARFAGFRSGSQQSLRDHPQYLARLWGYDQNDAAAEVQPRLLSTDEPFSAWFDEQMRSLSAVDW
ncbi:MAG: hypothetical protein ACON3Z_11035 [Bradymonadia bacterium]